MIFSNAAKGMILVSSSDVSEISTDNIDREAGIQRESISPRVMLAEGDVDGAIAALARITESAVLFRHPKMPSRDVNAMFNAVDAHMVLLHASDNALGLKSKARGRVIESFVQAVNVVHARLQGDNPKLAESFLTQVAFKSERDVYDPAVRKAVQQVVARISGVGPKAEAMLEAEPV